MNKPDERRGPANPFQVGHIERHHPADMTLLDYFASQALVGLMSQPDERKWFGTAGQTDEEIQKWRLGLFTIDAETCYVMAQAMIEARKRLEDE